jgi:Domain of unknown function (DUF4116)
MSSTGRAWQYAPEAWRENDDAAAAAVVLAAVVHDGRTLQFALTKWKRNRSIVLAAVQNYGGSLGFAAKECQQDREIVLAALKSTGWSLAHDVPEEFVNDTEIVMAAVQSQGSDLVFASPDIQNNPAIVLQAVQQSCGEVLEHVSVAMRSNREIVTAAIRNSWRAFRFAAPELQQTHEIMILTLSQVGTRANQGLLPRLISNDLQNKLEHAAKHLSTQWQNRRICDDSISKSQWATEYRRQSLEKIWLVRHLPVHKDAQPLVMEFSPAIWHASEALRVDEVAPIMAAITQQTWMESVNQWKDFPPGLVCYLCYDQLRRCRNCRDDASDDGSFEGKYPYPFDGEVIEQDY